MQLTSKLASGNLRTMAGTRARKKAATKPAPKDYAIRRGISDIGTFHRLHTFLRRVDVDYPDAPILVVTPLGLLPVDGVVLDGMAPGREHLLVNGDVLPLYLLMKSAPPWDEKGLRSKTCTVGQVMSKLDLLEANLDESLKLRNARVKFALGYEQLDSSRLTVEAGGLRLLRPKDVKSVEVWLQARIRK